MVRTGRWLRRGRQWVVTSYDLECLTEYYPIRKARVWEHLPGYSWPEHMAEKEWVDLEDFIRMWRLTIETHYKRRKFGDEVLDEAGDRAREKLREWRAA